MVRSVLRAHGKVRSEKFLDETLTAKFFYIKRSSSQLNLELNSQVKHMLFVPDIFALKRTNGIDEISRYSDFDR